MSYALIFPRGSRLRECERNGRETTKLYDNLLESLSEDIEITADSWYIPHMYRFQNVYQYPDNIDTYEKTEYLLVSKFSIDENVGRVAEFIGTDYELLEEAGPMRLYRLKQGTE